MKNEKKLYHSLTALSIALTILFVACDNIDMESDPLSPDLHECTPYVATIVWDTIIGNYDAANDKPTGSLTALAEAGGGYVEVSLTTESGTLVPGLQVRAVGDPSGAIISSSASGTMNPMEKKAGWSVAPGQSYDLTFTQGVNAPPEEYPVRYTLDWTFTGTMDCYEPNDTAPDAKQVPVGTTIEAFAMAGYTSNFLLAVEYEDWYKIVLNRDSTIEAALTVAPGDHRMSIKFWEADGTTQLAHNTGNAGGETFTTTATLTAGTYLMSVEVADSEWATWDNDDAPPAFWSAPYQVELREVL